MSRKQMLWAMSHDSVLGPCSSGSGVMVRETLVHADRTVTTKVHEVYDFLTLRLVLGY